MLVYTFSFTRFTQILVPTSVAVHLISEYIVIVVGLVIY